MDSAAAAEGEEHHEIVVVGGGICGLATALALHRKGIAGVAVLERSESLRATGAAIGVLPNGWRALDQLGVGPQLRQDSLLLQGGRDIWIDERNHQQQKMLFLTGEARGLKRSDLMLEKELADALPSGTIYFGSHIVSLKMDPQNQHCDWMRWIQETILGFPTDFVEMIQGSDAESVSFTHLRHRAPWDILVGSFCKGPVTVAGDAMHVMSPFLGQGGSAGPEDAVVLARNLAQKIGSSVNLYEYADEREEENMSKKIGEAFHGYVEESRMRLVCLSTQTYLVGTIAATTSPLLKFIAIVLMFFFQRSKWSHKI